MIITSQTIQELEKEISILQTQIKQERNKIELYSTYDTKLISNIMLILISTFEGESFCINKRDSYFDDTIYLDIERPKNNQHFKDICFTIAKTSLTQRSDFPEKTEMSSTSILVPKAYLVPEQIPITNHRKRQVINRKKRNDKRRLTIPKDMNEEDISYIENFLEELFQYRLTNQIIQITEEELTSFLNHYLEKNQEQIQKRRSTRQEYIDQKNEEYQRKVYQNNCSIERKPLIDSITYLINHSPDINYQVKNDLDYDWRETSGWSKLYLFHQMDISSNQENISTFKSLKGFEESFPDETEYAEATATQKEQDKFINFFEFKQEISQAINQIPILKQYLEQLEEFYQTDQTLTEKDILEIFASILNQKKHKTYTLTKENIISL